MSPLTEQQLNDSLESRGLNLYVRQDEADNWDYSVYVFYRDDCDYPLLHRMHAKSVAHAASFIDSNLEFLEDSAQNGWGVSIHAN